MSKDVMENWPTFLPNRFIISPIQIIDMCQFRVAVRTLGGGLHGWLVVVWTDSHGGQIDFESGHNILVLLCIILIKI